MFLETAELRAKNRQELTINFWRENIDKIIELNDKTVLKTPGSTSHQQMEKLVEAVYEKYDSNRKLEEARQADASELEELNQLESKLKRRKR